jgi:hypothetical protein
MLRLLAAEGMVALGTLSLDGTKLAGNAAHKASRTLPQTGKLLAEAAEADAAENNQQDGNPPAATPQALARRAGRAERLAAASGVSRLTTPSSFLPASRAEIRRGISPPRRC